MNLRLFSTHLRILSVASALVNQNNSSSPSTTAPVDHCEGNDHCGNPDINSCTSSRVSFVDEEGEERFSLHDCTCGSGYAWQIVGLQPETTTTVAPSEKSGNATTTTSTTTESPKRADTSEATAAVQCVDVDDCADDPCGEYGTSCYF